MAALPTEWVMAHPNFEEPDIILQQNQASGAFETLAGGNPRTKIGPEDKYVYTTRLDVRTRAKTGAAGGNMLPSCQVVPTKISIPTYLQQCRAEYDHHDIANANAWGINLPEAQRLAMRQAHFQGLRDRLLYGVNPGNGEGLLHANGATSINLPQDPYGNTTASTYDPGSMALFMVTQFSATKTRTYQLGTPRKFTILGPQRILSQFEYQGIVQLTTYQRAGAGTASVAKMTEDIATWNGDEVNWVYDDTLIGQGASFGAFASTDVVLIVMPEIKVPRMSGINTNEFGKLTPGFNDCTVMYTDMAAPMEIPTPLAGGAIDILSEMRASPGWGVRPEAITIINMPH